MKEPPIVDLEPHLLDIFMERTIQFLGPWRWNWALSGDEGIRRKQIKEFYS
jgi:hypothetical protein